ncbi:hypothetical protein HJG60_011881 [Phyllostomus discolor]|uniref:Uncharacterized protein n=1 Tax=Phyllostomus discolor TaxID=89673 RepID=A0A833ZPK7_9CHIR|nr:hypothetical protein HJG60_011881 [Phyllostomus discolor]
MAGVLSLAGTGFIFLVMQGVSCKPVCQGCSAASSDWDQRGPFPPCQPSQPQDTQLCSDKGKPSGCGEGHPASVLVLCFRPSSSGGLGCQTLARLGPRCRRKPSEVGGPPQGRATLASWSRGPAWGWETARGPHEGGLETSLQAFQIHASFFFPFHYRSHSGDSKHRQTRPTTTRQGADREGKATSMYMLSCSSRTDGMASRWAGGEPFPGGRAGRPLGGCGGLTACTWGWAAAALSERLAVTGWGGSGGQRGCGPSLGARLSWCRLWRPGYPTQEGDRVLREEKPLQVDL